MEEILRQAEALEKKYDWLGAAESCKKALKLVPEHDFSREGDINERLGYAFYRAAFQAESNSDFKDRMPQAIVAYERAKGLYERLSKSVKMPRILRSDAMTTFIGYWLEEEAPKKKKLIDDCWRLASEALKTFEETGEGLEYGRTFNQFSKSADLAFCLEWNSQIRERVMREVTKYGEQAIKFLSTLQNDSELAKAYVKTADYLYALGYSFLRREDQERQFEKARGYWQKAKVLSEEAAILESLSILQGLMLEFGAGAEETLRFYQRALEFGKKTADNFIVGCAFDMLAYHTDHMAWTLTENPDKMIRLAEKGLQYATEAKRQYSKISFVGPGGYGFLWVEAPYAEYYCLWASKQTDPNERQDLAKKAAEAWPGLQERAVRSGYPDAVAYAHHVMGKILTLLVGIETDSGEKKRLLEEALQHKKEDFRIIEQIAPSMYWERGVALIGIGGVKSLLADLASDSETKRKMLLEAIEDEQESFKLLAMGIISLEREDSLISILGYTQYQCGLLLNRVYEFSHNREYLKRAAETFEEAAGYYGKFGLTGRVAECHWKTAQTYDILDEHLKAAEEFDLASDDYKRATERVPQLKDLYQDHVLYMQAWSEIEKARNHHERQEYGLAKDHFEKAAELHKSLKRWSYLEPNYSAWTRVEDAEELSRKEQGEKAMKAFEYASKLFAETKKSIETQFSKTGFQTASEYSKAMEHLFDAYLYVDEAKREKDPDKKARLYIMAEKVLQTSAGAFTKAEHPEKREQVSRLLDKTREEKELALSLSEVLHAPSIVSTTTAFTALTPNQENAVGLERFENADIQASLIIRQRELRIGENLNLELELVNAGKGSALLTKVTEIIPKEFELAERPDNCRVEDSYLNLRGKRLDPLKTEELKLVLRPTVQGTFSLKPTVLYLDENGKYKSYEPEPVTIVVKELGIKSWLKGER